MAILLALLPTTVPATSSAPPSPAQASESTPLSQPPLHSRKALDAYLAAHSGSLTPLDLLPPLARQRFLESLVFGRTGLAGFNAAELAYELSDKEIVEVLSLFGAEEYARMAESRHPDGAPGRANQVETQAVGPLETGFHRLYQLQQSEQTQELRQEAESLIAQTFESPDGIGGLNDRELIYLLRSIELISFNAARDVDARRLREVVDLMADRGIARKQDFELVHAKLLETRQFDTADAYAQARPESGISELPKMEDTLGPQAPAMTVWISSNDGMTLRRTEVDLAPTQIVVTAGCHFSRDAATDINKDPVLGPVFAKHSRWLMLPPGKEDLAAVREWNQDHPAAQAQLVYDRAEWTILPKGWQMPTFFIVRKSKVIKHISGWRRGDAAHRQRLIEMLEESGLLDATPSR